MGHRLNIPISLVTDPEDWGWGGSEAVKEDHWLRGTCDSGRKWCRYQDYDPKCISEVRPTRSWQSTHIQTREEEIIPSSKFF